MSKQKKREKLGKVRIPIPRPGTEHNDRSKYSRKRKHKKDWREQ